jgi:GT2 family glycosyltransferase
MKKGRIYAVHYGENVDITKGFVDSLNPFLDEQLDLVLINNSKKTALDNLKGKFITVLDTGDNLGYFGGVRYGLDHCPIDDRNYVIVWNNDIRILNLDFFEILDAKLDVWDIIAPSIITLDGIEQNPHRKHKPSRLRKIYYEWYCAYYFLAWIFNVASRNWKKITKRDLKKPKESVVFSPHGACIVLKSTYFEKGGIIDHGYFLYGEEDSIAAMAERFELKVGFVPSLQVQHLESVSTGKGFSHKKYEYEKAAHGYIRKTYKFLYE